MKTTRRALLFATISLIGLLALPFAAGAAALGGFAPTSSGGGGSTLATMPITNDGVSTMNAGQPSYNFGWLFKDGDICSGAAPQFIVGDAIHQ